jgi:hypothetical protein
MGSFRLGEWLNEEASHSGLLSPLEIEAELQPAPSMSWINWSISGGDKPSAELMSTVLNGRPRKGTERNF